MTDTPAEEEAAPVEQRQMDAIPRPEDRNPDDWTEPGDWQEGYWPGDPNYYPDPENIPRAW